MPGGASARPTPLESRPTTSTADNITDPFASVTAPARLCHNAMPAATPTLVTMRRIPSNSKPKVVIAPALPRRDAATNASVAGFQMVSRMQRRSSQPRIGSGLQIRGWLLLLCILLTIWNPATLAVLAAARVGNAGTITAFALIVLGIRLMVTSVGVAAGMALWRRRAGAVRLAKASLVLSAIEAVARLSTRVGLSEAPPGTRLPLALALIIYDAAWYLYLEKSRRVRATYGLESAPERSG